MSWYDPYKVDVDGIEVRMRADDPEGHDAWCEKCEQSKSAVVVLQGMHICYDCLTEHMNAMTKAQASWRDPKATCNASSLALSLGLHVEHIVIHAEYNDLCMPEDQDQHRK